MNSLKRAREAKGISQRRLATLARISYKSLQLMESGKHDPKISTLRNVVKALGYPPDLLGHRIDSLFSLPEDSIAIISARMASEGEGSWKLWLFNFVDAFRASRKKQPYIEEPPAKETPVRIKALLASTVETLCAERGMVPPSWCIAVPSLEEPWFVADVEGLKSLSLVESPVHFRKRNIFVLGNFLERR